MGETAAVDGTLVALRGFAQAVAAMTEVTPAAASVADECGVPDRLARVRVLEDLRSQVAALQAVETASYAAERATAAEAEVVTVARPGVGRRRRLAEARRVVIADLAAARRISPWQARRWLTFAEQTPADLPATFGLLRRGRLSERRAELVFRAVKPLEPELRGQVDATLAPDLPDWGDRRVNAAAQAAVYALDPHGAVARHAHAASQRRVTVRPAPEGMARVTGVVALPQAVAVLAELERAARDATALGDSRTHGQLLADALVTRLRTAAATNPAAPPPPDPLPVPHPAPPPVTINLLIRADTVLGLDHLPARFPDGTPWPAPAARTWLFGDPGADTTLSDSDGTAVRVRRLFTDPVGRLVTAETSSRTFTPARRQFIRLRDGLCVTPFCDAPIRHADHRDAHRRSGHTRLDDADGTCQWCNTTKSDRPTVTGPDAHRLDPTPDRAGTSPRRRRRRRSPVERRLRRHLRREQQVAPRRPPTSPAPRPRPDVIHHRC